MKRIPEQEIMEDEQQVLAYAQADFSDSNQQFCDLLIKEYGTKIKHILDLGCGPADIPIRLVRMNPELKITAIDASPAMLDQAQKAIIKAGYQEQITIIKDRIPGLKYVPRTINTIISKDLLHHLPDPMQLWDEIIKMAAKANRKLVVFVMDLCRPATRAEAQKIVNDISGDEPANLRDDFYNSLLASFTIDEVEKQLSVKKLNLQISKLSRRHMLVKGIIDK